MHCTTNITPDLYYVGASDRRCALFENIYPIPRGVSYNSYLLCDEKTVLFDTVDHAVSARFFENIEFVLGGRSLDYIIVSHMEPDHAACIADILRRYPSARIVCSGKTVAMLGQFFCGDISRGALVVGEGDTLVTGAHTLHFVMAPMVHWPEVMVTFDSRDKILFSADAFGAFGALCGGIFDDVLPPHYDFDDERLYYTNIVGKYGAQVQALLSKAATLDIELICPLHGVLRRRTIAKLIEKYNLWSSYTPEQRGVAIVYASIYGNTENAADILAARLYQNGVKDVAMLDVSSTHVSSIISQAFRLSHLVFAAPTYNAGIFPAMRGALEDIAAHKLQNRAVAIIQNGSWAPSSGKQMRDILYRLDGIKFIGEQITLTSAVGESERDNILALADELSRDILPPRDSSGEGDIDSEAIFKLSYGIYLVSVRDGERDNACIINTVSLVTDSPRRISVTINKMNLTHDMLLRSKKLTVSILSVDTPFKIFERFGFHSGRDSDKFEGLREYRDDDGVRYLGEQSCAVISAAVSSSIDCGTHTIFIADVISARVLDSSPAATYEYYQSSIKPKPVALPQRRGFVCKVCGYFYEGDSLPDDFICPLCKHGAEDFEPVGF